ncbi:MAG: alpha/beta hydrolase family protein [Oceanicaulis sp.]
MRWTQSEVGGLDASSFVEPELITYESFDGLEIPGFYYRAEGEGPRPVIIDIHGGPESQERPGFNTSIQYWVNELGVSVITPNVRGSSGYGKDYVAMDNGFNREDSVRDIGALLDWVAGQPELDSERVVVYGGSYGGYMVLASMTHYSDRLAGGINIVGISNFVTFLENTNGYRRDLRRAEYGDERDPEMRAHLEAISPANQAERITAPLFIIQGANDPRVPASEAEQILAAVRAEGGDPWYLLALDEGHGFAKKSNRDFQRQAETMFLTEVLNLD